MADKPEIEAETSAEKAYAAASEAVSVKSEPAPAAAVEAGPAEVEFPSKAKRATTPEVAPAPKAAARSAAKKAAKPRRKAAAKKSAAKTGPVAAKLAKAKPVAARPAKPKTPKTPKAVVATAKPASNPKIKPALAARIMFQQLKDKTMDTAEFTTKMKSAVTEVQGKAKEALDKGAAAFNEYNEFSKGNLEAVVQSGKILATGMQSLGSAMAADTKAAFETLTAEAKELTTVKTPADFFKLQTEFLRRNFDTAVAMTSKNSEAVLKIASDAAAPISGRFSLAVEKVKKAA
jgi:phasin family protein